MALTALQIRHAKAGMHSDGNGLYLQVSESGSKSWLFRFQLNGKRREMGLGGLTEKPATEARMEATVLKVKLKNGIDPLEEKRQATEAAQVAKVEAQARGVTFKAAALEFIQAKKAGWRNAKHEWQWENSLSKFVFGVFGDKPASEVSDEDVLLALKPIWLSKTETATRVRQRIEAVLDYARVMKWRTGENPARWRGHLEHLLPSPGDFQKKVNQPALPYEQMADFMSELRLREGDGARALELAILTAARSGEVRMARWSEIDLDNKVWVIPAARMKAKREHRIPLTDRAVELLKAVPRIVGEDLVFPGKKKDKPLSDVTLIAAIRRMNLDRLEASKPKWADARTGEGVVPHGFRSTFRDWAAEKTLYPNEMAEMALAHSVADKVEAAYRRGDMFDKRRQMMDDWAAWCAPKDGVVVSIMARSA